MRKKKVLVSIILGLFVFFAFVISTIKPVSAENITVTTYYPSPHGVYKALNVSELMLKPLDEAPEDPVEGMIFFQAVREKMIRAIRLKKVYGFALTNVGTR